MQSQGLIGLIRTAKMARLRGILAIDKGMVMAGGSCRRGLALVGCWGGGRLLWFERSYKENDGNNKFTLKQGGYTRA